MRSLRLMVLGLSTLLSTLLFHAAAVAAAEFPLKEGDVWVMAGDSITAQHLHSNYFEAFCFARYPSLKFAFRNSGVGGHTIPSTLARYDYDIDGWKPTIVSVELGMNDQGGFTPEQYIANMTTMVERIRAGKARPIMFTASPINNGDTLAKIGGNGRLQQYAKVLKEFSGKQDLLFADQFHLLVDVWGKNKPREILARTLPALQALATDEQLVGSEHLKAFLSAQEKTAEQPVSMEGDPVHPGPPGQLMMAAALLKELNANPFVSSVSLEASGKGLEAKGCKVDNVKAEGGKLSFDRLDTSLPFPIPADGAQAVPLYPTIDELSQYTLQVKGLDGKNFSIKVNGVALPRQVTAEALGKGVNLTSLANARSRMPAAAPNAIAQQGQAVLNAVATKEGLVGQWRGVSQRAHAAGAPAELKTALADINTKVVEADAKIREAATPKPLHFEISAAE